MKEAPDHKCPRCGGPVPREGMQGKYPGALSRLDNLTEICSACGTDEAMQDYFQGGITPMDAWPIEELHPIAQQLEDAETQFRANMMAPTLVRCVNDPSLWWSNDHGWGSKDTATEFSAEEAETLTLPMEGEWYTEVAAHG